MEENIWKYGLYELDKKALLKYLQSNANSYIEYNGYDDNLRNLFNDSLSYIMKGIEDNRISGNGLGIFTENDTNLEEDDVTKYVHTIANSMGKKFDSVKKKEDKENEKETSLQEMFDYNKHGLSYGFNRKHNPFGTDGSYSLWKSGFKSQEDLNNSLLDYIGQHKTNIQNSNYDFSKSLIDKDSYINMLTDLENDIRTNGIQDSDKLKLKSLGFNPDSFVLQQLQKSDSPWGHIKWDNQTTNEKLPEEAPTVPEGFKAVLQLDGSYEIVPNEEILELNLFNVTEFWNSLDDNDKTRLITILPELGSAISAQIPGWGTVASGVLGIGSTLTNLINDITDEEVSAWDTTRNAIFSGAMDIVGLIPGYGITGKASKIAKVMKPIASTLIKAWGAYGLYNASNSLEKLLSDPSNVEAGDLQNILSGVLVLAGMSSNIGTKRLVNRNTSSKDVVEIKTKSGKTTEITPELLEDLKKTKGLEEQNKKFKEWTGEELPKEFRSAQFSFNPKKIRVFSDGPSTNTKTVKSIMPEASGADVNLLRRLNNEKTTNNVNTTNSSKSEDVMYNTTTSKYELTPEEQKYNQRTPEDKVLNDLAKAESGVNKKPEEKKIEVSKPKEEPKEEPKSVSFQEARKIASEKKTETVPATEIKPDIQSKVTESANIKSEVTKYNASDVRKEFEKLKGKYKKKVKFISKNAKLNIELADLVKQDPSLASKDFNEMLTALQKADKNTTYEQAFKMLTEAGFYKEGGIIKAETGTKVSGTPRNNNLWYSSIGSGFMHKLAQGLINGDYTYLDINMMLDRHFDLDNLLSKDVDNPSFNLDVQNYYNDINNHFKFVNTDGIKLGEDNSRYKIVENAITKDSHLGGWVADGYYSGRGQDRMLLGKRGDYTDEELSKTMKFWENAGFKMYLDDKTNYYKIDPISTIEGYEGTIKIPEVTVTATYPGGPKTPPQEKVEISKPEKPNQSFFTTDKALAVLNYFRARGHNKELLDLANRMVPLLYDPMEHHRSVYGNLRAISEGNRAAGEIRSRASKPLTSDGSLQTAGLLEAENLAQQYIRQGWLSDDETMQKMSELAWQQEKENRENRYNIAMKNRENMHLVSKEKLMALMGKKRADYESLTNHINEWRTWIGAKQQADEDKANILFNRQMLNYIQNNPLEYISNWKLYEKLWNRYNNGETLSADELRTISQIQNHLSNAYYNEIYGKGDYFGYGITRSPWNPILKKGGTITKNQVDAIIKYLKESNNNYNKAVDRSVRGLYNHIKLQRKK